MSTMATDNSSVLSDIAPPFRPYLQNIYQELELGLCKNKVDLERTSHSSDESETQFQLILPYCSKKLRWEVIFDPSVPWFAPDFRFDDETFMNNIDEEYVGKHVPSLLNWDSNDPKALRDVIKEMINLYKLHQVEILSRGENSRAHFEYSALLGNALTTEQDIEVLVNGHIVEFLIKLKVETSRLPELYDEGIEQNPGIDSALLLVRYPNSTNAELIMSPFLAKALGNISLPLMHQSGVLMDYVPMVTEMLNDKVQEILNNDKLKRELLGQLIVKYEGAVLEHDPSSAAFLFEMKGFHWILQIDIGVRFPENLPILTLRSVYHTSKGRPKSKVLPNCPYTNFEGYIEQQVEIFKNECKGFCTNNQIINLES